jgi:hypothetical protein
VLLGSTLGIVAAGTLALLSVFSRPSARTRPMR